MYGNSFECLYKWTICSFQDIRKIFPRIEACTDRQINRIHKHFSFFSESFKKVLVIYTFQQSWKVLIHLVYLSICPSIHALNLVNIFPMSWNLCMLFIFNIAWIVLKMAYVILHFVYRLTQKFSNTLWPMVGKFLQRILTNLYSSKFNEINIHHSDVTKACFL